MRLFIAIPLGRVMKERIGAVQEEFRRQRVRGNYTPAENLHVTLAFIGEFGDPDRVLDAVSTVRFRPFRITLDGIGRFDRLWWTGVSKSPELEKLAHNVRYALAENGIPFDRKRFRPHITILRKPEYAQGEPQGIDVDPVSMTVDGVSLMRSDRGKNGMIYTEVGFVSADEEAAE
ncbi:MAG: RNA 2',3'-cyclic phosphodiesterase [Oscillospiraceae bacterium]|nr:RNA 2',3'-cyclic phosphodiesterase [Oscillospiraceae bacterium]